MLAVQRESETLWFCRRLCIYHRKLNINLSTSIRKCVLFSHISDSQSHLSLWSRKQFTEGAWPRGVSSQFSEGVIAAGFRCRKQNTKSSFEFKDPACAGSDSLWEPGMTDWSLRRKNILQHRKIQTEALFVLIEVHKFCDAAFCSSASCNFSNDPRSSTTFTLWIVQKKLWTSGTKSETRIHFTQSCFMSFKVKQTRPQKTLENKHDKQCSRLVLVAPRV